MTRTVWIDGLALWAPGLPGWDAAQAAFCDHHGGREDDHDGGGGGRMPTEPGAAHRPAPDLLSPNERRRAPDSVLLALQVASAAVAASGHAAAELASVFTSAHGDSAVVDALCRTLAADPLRLSPTRFHHSVHNGPSGYWAMASGSHVSSTALAAFDRSFAAGLLEALTLCAADERPVLLVGTDTPACGALASVNRSRGLLGVALVLAPQRGPASRWALAWSTVAGEVEPPALHSAAARALSGNAQADALPLFEALARAPRATGGTDGANGTPGKLALPLPGAIHLALGWTPVLGHHAATRSKGPAP